MREIDRNLLWVAEMVQHDDNGLLIDFDDLPG